MTLQDGALRVATSAGVVQVTGDAKVSTVDPAVATRVDGPFRLYPDRLEWATGRHAMADAVDLLDRGDGALVLFPDRLEWWPNERRHETLASGLSEPRALANVADGHVVVVCADRLYDTVDMAHPITTGLVDARAAAADAGGRLYVVQGEPPELFRVDGGSLALVARHVGDVRDLVFGGGGLLPRENIYLLRAEGQVDYLRPP